MRNEYTIFISDDASLTDDNKCLLTMAGITFPGNVIVVRQSSQKRDRITHLSSNERTLVDLVVFRYVNVS